MIDIPPRRFQLVRHSDPVAEGAVWSSGAVAIHWPGHPRATSVWANLDDVRIAQGEETSIRFLDEETKPKPDRFERDKRGWPKFGGAAIPLPDTPHDPRD